MVTAQVEMRDEWIRAANEMDVANAEYMRRMVNAGRRQFGDNYDPDEVPTTQRTLKLENKSSETDLVKEFVHKNLSTEEGRDESELFELIKEDVTAAADELTDEGKAKYRGGEGGWIKVTDDV